jgi:hypothetical protein
MRAWRIWRDRPVCQRAVASGQMAGRTYTKRDAGPGEIAMYRVLASLAPLHNSHFTALLLPAAISIDPARGLLVLPRYDGEDLAARWHESDGGARLGTGLATAIPAVLEDLARIDTACATTDPVPHQMYLSDPDGLPARLRSCGGSPMAARTAS